MATRTGKRNMNWRNDEAATLYYVEVLMKETQKIKSILEMMYSNGKRL
jgi:hypothetical protein